MANIAITGLPAAATSTLADTFVLVQGGTDKQITGTALFQTSTLAFRSAAGAAATAGLQVGASTVGLFSGGSGATEYIGLTANGTEVLRSTSSRITATALVGLANGSAANPSLTFTNSTSTGMYRQAADAMAFVAAGTAMARIGTVGVRIQSNVSLAATDIFQVYSNTLSKSIILAYEATAGVAIGSDSSVGAGGTSGLAVGGASVTGGAGAAAFGSNALASGDRSYAFGRRSTTRSIHGSVAIAAGNIPIADVQGVCQTGMFNLGTATTDATPTILRTNTAAAGTSNQATLPNNSAYKFRGTCIATVTGAGDTASWVIEGCIKRGANAASTALVGTPTVTQDFADSGAAGWTLAVTADTTNGCIAVTATGEVGKTIRWNCFLQTTEVTY